jgi:uncharacterized membrane-anchored protein
LLSLKLGGQAAAAVLCLGLLALAIAIPQTWLRTLLGAAAAGFAQVAFNNAASGNAPYATVSPWLAQHLLLAVVLLVTAVLLKNAPKAAQARSAAFAEAVGAGWLLSTLAGLALWAGTTFLVGASMDMNTPPDMANRVDGQDFLPNAVSAVLALLGGVWLSRRWSALRQAWCGGVVLVLAALAALMPTLGACLLVLALCAGTQRWRLAAVAAVASAWIIGAFYYALRWPLANKAAALVIAATVLAALAVWGFRSLQATQTPAAPGPDKTAARTPALRLGAHWGIALSAVLILLAANVSIWQKEQLIRHGQTVFVPLVPVDPRSLMQGDYMALNFLRRWNPNTPKLDMDQEAFGFEHPRMVFQRDAQGIVRVLGPDEGKALASDEIAIQLVPKNGRWILVTDAFYFKEGEAERWAAARFGEFRVEASGKALLVGLRGDGLKPL